MTGTSPPRPFRCGSVTWSTSPAATAASKALPPRSSTAMPAAEASQCVEATMPNVPASSGRVVNSGIPPMVRSSHHVAAGQPVCRLAERAGLPDDYSSLFSVTVRYRPMPTIPRAAGRARGRRAVPLALTAAVTVAAAGLLTGCGSAQAPQPTAPPTVPGLDGLTVCQSAALKVTVDTSQAGGAAGSVYYPVNFTNTSGAPCGLYGYPGMSFVTAAGNAGRQIGEAAQRDPAFGDLSVRLPADGVAHAWLQVAQAGNYPASACQPMTAHWLRVFPPGDTAATYVGVSFS